MTPISAARARAAAAARATGDDDWGFDSQWDDEVGPSWIKDYTGGVKHRGHPISAPPALGSKGSKTTDS